MGVRQYIGARYVPKFFENPNNTAEWLPNVIYEPLTIVTYGLNTYTSKKPVPASVGNPAENPNYWVATSNFNEQLQEVIEDLETLTVDVETIDDTLHNRITNTFNNVVFIGDSYATVRTPNYTDHVATFLGITNKYVIAQGGYGIEGVNNNRKWIDLLNNSYSNILNRDAIEHVVVAGGANDAQQNDFTTFKNDTIALKNRIRELFPNATIYFAFIAWSADRNHHSPIRKAFRDWSSACQVAGVKLLKYTDVEMHNYAYLSQVVDDKQHPNGDGETAIGRALSEALLNGASTYYGTSSSAITGINNFVIVNGTIKSVMMDNINTIHIECEAFGNGATAETFTSLTRNSTYTIGTYDVTTSSIPLGTDWLPTSVTYNYNQTTYPCMIKLVDGNIRMLWRGANVEEVFGGSLLAVTFSIPYIET